MSLLRQLAPLAIVAGGFGLLIAILLRGGDSLGNLLLAAFLFGHGAVHAMYVLPEPRPTRSQRAPNAIAWPFQADHSWLLSSLGLSRDAIKPFGSILAATTAAGYSVAALATIPLLIPAFAWAPLVLISTAASLSLLTLFPNRALVIGVAIDLVLIWVVLASVWLPGV